MEILSKKIESNKQSLKVTSSENRMRCKKKLQTQRNILRTRISQTQTKYTEMSSVRTRVIDTGNNIKEKWMTTNINKEIKQLKLGAHKEDYPAHDAMNL